MWQESVRFVPGVGPRRAQQLAGLGIETVGDLVEHFPFRHERQPAAGRIADARIGENVTVIGEVVDLKLRRRFRRPGVLLAAVADDSDQIVVRWFNAAWLADKLAVGRFVRLVGKVSEYDGFPQLVNPATRIIEDPAEIQRHARLIPVYPAGSGLTSPQIARWVDAALDRAGPPPEFLPPDVLATRGLPPRSEAVRQMHHPDDDEQAAAARRRLAYEELFVVQMAVALWRRHREAVATAQALAVSEQIDQRIRRRFPFTLTASQDRAVGEIAADLATSQPMNRLLQGDVGSGKTVVALYAALLAVARKHQAAIMAPTEILASQHHGKIARYLAGSRVRFELLIGSTPAGKRRQILAAAAAGELDLLVGTQALLEADVRFARLGLVVVDEQHKFGVRQRAGVRGKGPAPHYLVMTATPIPRTLAMTAFGDLDVTTIDRPPAGRAGITTRQVSPADVEKMWDFTCQRLADGDQAYIVCPLLNETGADCGMRNAECGLKRDSRRALGNPQSATSVSRSLTGIRDPQSLTAATAEFERLRTTVLRDVPVGLLHGQMPSAQKQQVARDFAAGRIRALVATTVIEVGIDMPAANVMIIEHAERYGLSQLHQLRGRVGRGGRRGYCFLVAHDPSDIGRQRLDVLCRTTDGFRIAEEDLRLRGPGELIGLRQSGLPELKVASLIDDYVLLTEARTDAAKLTAADPRLTQPHHRPLREELLRRLGDKLALLGAG